MSIAIPYGTRVPLAPASWVAVGEARQPASAQEDEHRAWQKCTAGLPASKGINPYYLDANKWYNFAENVTDGKRLKGVYFQAYVFGNTNSSTAWNFEPTGTLLGGKTVPRNIATKNFIDRDEACGHVEIWFPAGRHGAADEGHWSLQGVNTGVLHSRMLVVDARAVIGDVDDEDCEDGSEHESSGPSGSSPSATPPGDGNVKLGVGFIIPALAVGALSLLAAF